MTRRPEIPCSSSTVVTLAFCVLGGTAVACTPSRGGPASNAGSRTPTGDLTSATAKKDMSVLSYDARLSVFDNTVSRIRRYHEFSASSFRNRGRNWDDDVEYLRGKMKQADTHVGIMRIFAELQNSLLDPHLRFLPASTQAEQSYFVLPLTLQVSPQENGTPSLRIIGTSGGLGQRIPVGSEVSSFDGRDVSDVLEDFRFSSADNQDSIAFRNIATAIVQREAVLWRELSGKSVRLEYTTSDDGQAQSVDLAWERVVWEMPSLDNGLSLDFQCSGAAPANYGPYELSAVGARVCVYTSNEKPYRHFPIVRHHSFYYGHETHLARLDYWTVQKALKGVDVHGVVIDLRDNMGGDNPYVFLDWWAPGDYEGEYITVRLHEDLLDPEDSTVIDTFGSEELAEQYRERAMRGETTWEFPFLCTNPNCNNGHWTPKGTIIRAPIALLVGPQCASSCDTFAAVFSTHDFGILVGEPTAAAYTAYRMPLSVADDKGALIGTMHVAFSRSRIGSSSQWVEGMPLHIDVPVESRWEPSESYDRRVVEAAVRALQEQEKNK